MTYRFRLLEQDYSLRAALYPAQARKAASLPVPASVLSGSLNDSRLHPNSAASILGCSLRVLSALCVSAMNASLLLATAFAQDAMRASIEKQQASIAQQRESIRKQANSVSAWLVPWNPAPSVEPTCDPVSDALVAPLIDSAAKTEKLEAKLLRAVIDRESAFHACAVSPKGAMGLMQLMPSTVEQFQVADPFDPKQSIDAGAKFLKQLLDKYKGDLPQALGAYNAGPATVDQAGGIPDIPETREYVGAILEKMGITSTVQPSAPKPKATGN